MHKNENTQNSHSFLAPSFFRGICLSRHQQIWNQHFWIPILIFLKKKIFWVIIALFAILKCKCEKNCTFSNILQKVKLIFLPISIILRVIPIKFETLKAPTTHTLTEFQRMDKLPSAQPLGGQKPADVLHELVQYWPEGQSQSRIFHHLFQQRFSYTSSSPRTRVRPCRRWRREWISWGLTVLSGCTTLLSVLCMGIWW